MSSIWLDSTLRKNKPPDSVLDYYIDKKSCVYASKTFNKSMSIFANDYWDDVYDVITEFLKKLTSSYYYLGNEQKEILLSLFDSVCIVGDLVCEILLDLGEKDVTEFWRHECKKWNSNFFQKITVSSSRAWLIKNLKEFKDDFKNWIYTFTDTIIELEKKLDNRKPNDKILTNKLGFAKTLVKHRKAHIELLDRGISKVYYQKLLEIKINLHCDDIPEQIKRLKDPNGSVRSRAIDCLRPLAVKGVPNVVSSVVALLKDEEERVRMCATYCLQSFAKADVKLDRSVVSSLLALLQDENDSIRSLAFLCLESFAKKGLFSDDTLKGVLLELYKSGIDASFLCNILVLIEHYSFKLDYAGGYFLLALKEENKNIILDIDVKKHYFIFQESLQENNIIVNLKFKFNFKPQVILEIGGKIIEGHACRIISGITAQTATELVEKGSVQRWISKNIYERIVILAKELANKGHVWVALTGKAYNELKNIKLKFLATKSLAWYYWYYSITGEIPNEKELDSYSNIIQTLKQQKTNVTPQNILNEIAQNYEKINKKQEQKITNKIQQDLQS